MKRSVLAFMDILGYSEMIRKVQADDTQEYFLRRLHGALKEARGWLEGKEVSRKLREMRPKDDFALKAFTDNIVIAWPILQDAKHEFGKAVEKLTRFQLELILDGFFVRGALSIGDIFVDDIAVFGPALLEAHDGESKLARDPRIILTKSAVDVAKAHLKHHRPPEQAPHVEALLRDSDGQLFMNYLERTLTAADAHGLWFDELRQHREAVKRQLILNKDNPVIWSKYAWVAEYHNYFCNLHLDLFDEELRIDLGLYRSSPSPIVG